MTEQAEQAELAAVRVHPLAARAALPPGSPARLTSWAVLADATALDGVAEVPRRPVPSSRCRRPEPWELDGRVDPALDWPDLSRVTDLRVHVTSARPPDPAGVRVFTGRTPHPASTATTDQAPDTPMPDTPVPSTTPTGPATEDSTRPPGRSRPW